MEHKIAWTNCNKKYLTKRSGKCVFYIGSCHIMKGKKVYNHYILKIWSNKLPPPQLPPDASPIWLKPLVHDYQQTYFTNLNKKALVILIIFSIFSGKIRQIFDITKLTKIHSWEHYCTRARKTTCALSMSVFQANCSLFNKNLGNLCFSQAISMDGALVGAGSLKP